MTPHIRTAFVGCGVIAICIAMASLKGHQLLMAFAAASLLGAVWSWLQHGSKPRQSATPPVEKPARRRVRQSATVYQFPAAQQWQNLSDASS